MPEVYRASFWKVSLFGIKSFISSMVYLRKVPLLPVSMLLDDFMPGAKRRAVLTSVVAEASFSLSSKLPRPGGSSGTATGFASSSASLEETIGIGSSFTGFLLRAIVTGIFSGMKIFTGASTSGSAGLLEELTTGIEGIGRSVFSSFLEESFSTSTDSILDSFDLASSSEDFTVAAVGFDSCCFLMASLSQLVPSFDLILSFEVFAAYKIKVSSLSCKDGKTHVCLFITGTTIETSVFEGAVVTSGWGTAPAAGIPVEGVARILAATAGGAAVAGEVTAGTAADVLVSVATGALDGLGADWIGV